jgi:hypothetical protein
MHSQSLAWVLLFWQPVLSLSIPQLDAQIPMRTEQQQTTKTLSNTVILSYTADDSDHVQRAEIPVHKQIPSGRSVGNSA